MPNPSLPERLSWKLVRVFTVMVFAFLACSSFATVMDNVDLGWHIAQGRWMVQHFAFYRHDVFNYPNLGHEVIDEYPLFQLVLYAVWNAGWWGPCLLTALAYGALAAVLFAEARKLDAVDSMIFAMAVSLMLFCFQAGPMLRPHMVTYLAVVVLGVFLLRHREAARWTDFWPMALLQVAWTNCHSGFVIGLAMVGLFGAEVTIRRWIADRVFPRATALTWLGAFVFMLLACLVNPYGFARFYPPFVQEQLESIRAYVGEMEPLAPGYTRTYGMVFVIVLVLVSVRRGKTSWPGLNVSFLIFALLFFWEALSAKKAWPVFGLFVPLLVLSAALDRRQPAPFTGLVTGVQLLVMDFLLTLFVGLGVWVKYEAAKTGWTDVAIGHSELSHEAVAWMKDNHIQGKLFHRCEDGGLLQMEGFPQTFSDTGFGKFDEAFVHETGLVNERPALVPRYLAAYNPDFVVCSNWCFQWPYYLKQAGWRLIFYTPNSSVWTRPETRPDLATVTDDQIRSSFEQDLKTNGEPSEISLLGRNLIALHSFGLDDFAIAKLKSHISRSHFAWAWEAARIICFEPPAASESARAPLQIYLNEKSPALLDFQAHALEAAGKPDEALRLIISAPGEIADPTATLQLKIEMQRNMPEALALARLPGLFDLRNGKYWQYLAEAEERWGSLDAARVAWRKAVFYYPDDDELMKAAADFAAKHDDAALKQAIADSGKVYGTSNSGREGGSRAYH